ncbi:MAG: hypothetical protein UHN88_01200 [Eubacterium sp.]|nr:hypothetical protein [Eubacterium sp.]
MELWVSVTLLILCVAGFILAAKLLNNRPAVRRFVMLACVIFGAYGAGYLHADIIYAGF